MFEPEVLKQEGLAVRLGIPSVYGGVDVNNILHLKESDYFTVCKYNREGRRVSDLDDWLTTPSLELVAKCVEQLTGKVLEF